MSSFLSIVNTTLVKKILIISYNIFKNLSHKFTKISEKVNLPYPLTLNFIRFYVVVDVEEK